MKTYRDHLKEQKKKHPEVFKTFDEEYDAFKIEAIGELIKEKRKEKGLSQSQLAVLIHTKKQAISRLERNPSDVRISTLLKVSKALGTPLITLHS